MKRCLFKFVNAIINVYQIVSETFFISREKTDYQNIFIWKQCNETKNYHKLFVDEKKISRI